MSLLDLSLSYATEFQWKIIPLHNPRPSGWRNPTEQTPVICSCGNQTCNSIGKHPRLKIGLGMNGASSDPQKIKEWWTLWPQANIGIATGQSGLVVIDVDPKNGGANSLPSLTKKFPEINDMPRVRTGGDGLHFYCLQSPSNQINNSSGAIGPGIDTRGIGGLIVAPGSLHGSGKSYEWVKGFSPWDIRLSEPSSELARFIKSSKAKSISGLIDEKGLVFVKRGARNDVIARTVGLLHSKGFCREAIVACMKEFNVRQMEAPLPELELSRTIESILRYPRK